MVVVQDLLIVLAGDVRTYDEDHEIRDTHIHTYGLVPTMCACIKIMYIH